MKQSFSLSQRKEGSAFITVILFTFMLAVLIASIIGWSRNERLLTVRSAHWLEARNAAEALAEYGFAQVRQDFSAHSTTPSFDPAGTGVNNFKLSLPPGSTTATASTTAMPFWDPSGHVDLSPTSTYSLELIAGPPLQLVSPGQSGEYYIDSLLYDNQYDKIKGHTIHRHDVKVLARASVLSPEGGPPVVAYVEQTISARGDPLFANAIFYSNVDLEIFPGPNMTISGPVRCNGNIFASSQGGTLAFGGQVAMSGGLYHAWSNAAGQSEGSGSEALGTSSVTFITSTGTAQSFSASNVVVGTTSYGNIWVDSTMGSDAGVAGLSNLTALTTTKATADFRQEATTLWGGNVQTAAMGISVDNPISFSQVIDSAGDTPDPHSIIEPPATSTYLNSDPLYTTNKQEVEAQKFSTQAGMYILVTETPALNDINGNPIGPPTATIQIYGPAGSTQGNTLSTGPNGGPLIGTYNTQTANGLVKFIPYSSTTTGTASTTTNVYTLQGNLKYTKTATTVVAPISQINYSSGATSAALTGGSTSTSTSTTSNLSSIGTLLTTTSAMGSTTSSATTTIGSGLFDQRRQMGIDLVQIDASVLTGMVSAMVSNTVSATGAQTYTDAGGTHVWGAGSNATTPWNGGIYVDVEAPNAETSSQSASVILVNGQVASGSSLVPSWGGNTNGFTVATNAPVYVQGNFNANGGTITAASATTPDDGKDDSNPASLSAESPACIAADAITVLGPNFNLASSLQVSPTESANVEIAAAMLTGITTTTATASSGGAHNLPRFLENWSGSTVAIRGSLTCLYQSKVATQPWKISYYGAPTRVWGFDKIFQNGHYPPLTPQVMSYRRVYFNGDLSAANYLAEKRALYPGEY